MALDRALELNPQNSLAVSKSNIERKVIRENSKKELKDLQYEQRDKRLFGKTEKEIVQAIIEKPRKTSLYNISKLEP